MTPVDPKQFVEDSRFPGKFGKISMLRGSRTLFIYKAPEEIVPVNYKLALTTQVGGLGIKLFGTSVSTFEVTFTKNVYYPGEKVVVTINCDNSKCKTAVKCYKMKLFR